MEEKEEEEERGRRRRRRRRRGAGEGERVVAMNDDTCKHILAAMIITLKSINSYSVSL